MTAIELPHTNLAHQLELRRKLLLLWDEGDWQSKLQKLAKAALDTRLTPTQGRQLQNVCSSARACNDVYNFIYAQMGKANSPWPTSGWSHELVTLFQELKSQAAKNVPAQTDLQDRLALQSATLMLFRKCADSFSAFLNYYHKGGQR